MPSLGQNGSCDLAHKSLCIYCMTYWQLNLSCIIEILNNSSVLLSQLASGFEKKFLFYVGRHFWNAVAVGGFIAMATGGILAIQSSVTSQEERRLRASIRFIPSVESPSDFDEWFSRKCNYYTLAKGYEDMSHGWWCDRFNYITNTRKEGKRFDRICISVDPTGKRFESNAYVNGKCMGYEAKYSQIDDYASNYLDAYYGSQEKIRKELEEVSRIKNKNYTAEASLSSIEMEKAIKLGLGGIISAWGLGVIAVSALNAALLAIERNTRKDIQ